MEWPDEFELRRRICALLRKMGVTANYKGFSCAVQAVILICKDPERLQHVTKEIYPDVGRALNLTAGAVERDLRNVATIAWNANPDLLSQLAGYPLSQRPYTVQFLEMIAAEIFRNAPPKIQKTIFYYF